MQWTEARSFIKEDEKDVRAYLSCGDFRGCDVSGRTRCTFNIPSVYRHLCIQRQKETVQVAKEEDDTKVFAFSLSYRLYDERASPKARRAGLNSI